MPRTGRVLLPHCAHYIVQRRHKRRTVFAARCDYERYLDTLAKFKRVFAVKVYAWCLMSNHVHLRTRVVVDPADYPWSSCRFRLGEAACPWLGEDPSYLALCATAGQRRTSYWQVLRAAIPQDEWHVIRAAGGATS